MEKKLSLYLDAVRFLAALVVVADHLSFSIITGGLFWQLQPYGHLAVMVFFVLSGFVIAYVADTKERTLAEYSLSRAARLYSVVAPAILVTLVADMIGQGLRPEMYSSSWGFVDDQPVTQIIRALTFTTHDHPLFEDIRLFSNGPFWSMSYEFWYYVFFATVFYLRGWRRVLTATLALIAAGPAIIILGPVWWIGVAAYRICRSARPLTGLGCALFVGSIVTFGASEYLRLRDLLSAQEFLYDYGFAVLVAANFIGFRLMGGVTSFILRYERAIRYFAGFTFSIYLFHCPLLFMFGAAVPGEPSDWAHRLMVLVGSFTTIWFLALFTEHKKEVVREVFSRMARAVLLRAQAVLRA